MSAESEEDTVAEVERLTLSWVEEILDEPDVTLADNFLDLGGHSVLAVRLSKQARQHLGAEYDLMVLFEKDLGSAAADLASRVGPRSVEETA
ncbi:phosphopantetheine-binding protein [Streptomyces flavidovirens]|uniref:phosphopantetheine-binding protein n=1 Tax=Streptomyces flavidovirens TaxID=67298 RepID=UPI00341AE73D